MVLIISRVILFMIIALALGVMTAFPEQNYHYIYYSHYL